MKTRITTDLGDPRLIRLMKVEAQERGESMKDIIVRALEGYFSHQLEMKVLQASSDRVFQDWDNPLDSEYDKIS